MFKPYTIEQHKVLRYIEEQFVKGSVLISPDSRTALKVTDNVGDSLVFDYYNDHVVEVDERPRLSHEARKTYVKQFHADPNRPIFQSLEDIVVWWHKEERPISLQQAMNLPDDLYRYYLSHNIPDITNVRKLVRAGRVSEEEYLAIQLWYRDGNFKGTWLGSVGADGTGNLYELVLNYQTPLEMRFKFYLMDK